MPPMSCTLNCGSPFDNLTPVVQDQTATLSYFPAKMTQGNQYENPGQFWPETHKSHRSAFMQLQVHGGLISLHCHRLLTERVFNHYQILAWTQQGNNKPVCRWCLPSVSTLHWSGATVRNSPVVHLTQQGNFLSIYSLSLSHSLTAH